MEHIRALDEDLIRSNLQRLSFFYGRTDGWVPLAHYERMIATFPDADAHLCPPEIPHAFVLGHSDAVAKLVAPSLRRRLGLVGDPGPLTSPSEPALHSDVRDVPAHALRRTVTTA